MTAHKTYRVQFYVQDYYYQHIKARSLGEAIAKARRLYDREHEPAFIFDIGQGGPDCFEADEVAP